MTKTFKNAFSRQNRILLTEMIRTDFKLRYQGSVLGYLWSLLRPLFLFAVLYTVFTKFLHIGKGVPNYALSLLLGTILWSYFIEATTSALKSVVVRGSLIRKINIPRYLIPISVIASALINLLLNFVVVLIFLMFAKTNAITWRTFIWFPLLVLELTVFATAIGFYLSAVFVKYRDVEHIWDVIRQALFYMTPIIYPLTLIKNVKIQKLIMINPISQVIQSSRALITYDKTIQIHTIFHSYKSVFLPLSVVFVSCVIGAWYFKKHSKYFAEDI